MDDRQDQGSAARPSALASSDDIHALQRELERVTALARWDRRLLDAVLQQSPHGVVVCDAEGKLVARSAAAEAIWAGTASPDDTERWGKYRAFHPDGRPFAPDDWLMARCLRHGHPIDAEELRFQRFDGAHGYLLASCAPLRDDAGALAGAISVFTEITRFKLQSERLELLADGSRLFAEGSLDPAKIMNSLAMLLVPRVAKTCTIRLLSSDGRFFQTAAAREADPDLQPLLDRAAARPIPADSRVGVVLRTGAPVLLPEVDPSALRAEADESQWEYIDAAPTTTTLLIVPMRSRGLSVGVMSVTRSERGRPFDSHDQIVVQELADRAAMHWRKAQSFEAERRAREHAERLQSVTADLANARSVAEVATVIMQRGREATGAFGAMFFQLDGTRNEAVIAARQGYDASRAQRYDRVPMDRPLPIVECLQTGVPMYFENSEQIRQRYPMVAAQTPAAQSNAVAMLPLVIGGTASGAMVFSFVDARTFGSDERAFLEALANQAALALERARLADVEKKARERASFLAEASRLLTSSLEYEEILRELAALAVPRMGDWCAIDMIEEGAMRQIAVAHANPDRVRLARALRENYPPDPSAPAGALAVIRTGKAELHPAISDEQLAAAARDDEHLRLMRSLGFRSALIVPVAAHGRTLGAMTLAWAETDGRYAAEDLELAQELAGRAGLAIENARLYGDLRAAVQVREDFLAIAGHELRTPLFALLMQVQGVERLARKEPSMTKLADRLVRATASGARLEKLVGQLLDVSLITAGRLSVEPEPFDMGEMVREIAARFADEAAVARCELRIAAPMDIQGHWDRSRLDQVVSNLLSNALKYGRGKPVDVALSREGDSAVLRVTDRGIGIADGEQARLFGKFERAVAARDFGGMGLGLWITREIVDASGGTIEVCSSAGAGATFTVRLPVAAPAIRTLPPA